MEDESHMIDFPSSPCTIVHVQVRQLLSDTRDTCVGYYTLAFGPPKMNDTCFWLDTCGYLCLRACLFMFDCIMHTLFGLKHVLPRHAEDGKPKVNMF